MKKKIMALLGLLLATGIIYWPVASAPFLWDDDAHLIGPGFLSTWAGLRAVWLRPGIVQQYYPLTTTSFWVGFHLWGMHPFGYHALTLVFHCLNAVLFAGLLQALGVPASWLAALIFAVHPVHVESVAWVSELKNTQSTFFFLLAIHAYLAFDNKRWPWYAAALVSLAAALFTKTVTGVFAAVMAIVLALKRGRFLWRDVFCLAPFAVMALTFGARTSHIENALIANEIGWRFTISERALMAARAFWFYIGKLVWPRNLTFFYANPSLSVWRAADVFAACGFFFLMGGLWWARKRWGWAPFLAVLAYGALIFPALGFVNFYPMRYSYVADHFQYMASLPLIALIAALLWKAVDRISMDWLRRPLACAPCVVLAFLAWQHAQAFQSNEQLWQDTLEKNPRSSEAHSNLAAEFANQGRMNDAELETAKALWLKPDNIEARLSYAALLLYVDHRVDAAVAEFEKADADEMRHFAGTELTTADPAQTAYVLGLAYEKAGHGDQARAAFQQALERETLAQRSGRMLPLEAKKFAQLDPTIRAHLASVAR